MNCIVKKNLFFLTFFFLIGCASNSITTTNIACPNVFFATEHKKYIDSYTKPISIDNLNYSAEINNYAFNSDCLIIDDIIQAELSLLFIVNPYQVEVSPVNLPFYVAILNEMNEVVDMQYYQIEGNLKKDLKTKKYIEVIPNVVRNGAMIRTLRNLFNLGSLTKSIEYLIIIKAVPIITPLLGMSAKNSYCKISIFRL